MSGPNEVKPVYLKKSFSVDAAKLGMISAEELKEADEICFETFQRKHMAELLKRVGTPDTPAARGVRQLRRIMGDEFIEPYATTSAALIYWSLIAAQ